MLISVVAFSLMQICVKQLVHLPTTELVLVRSVFTLIFTYALIKRLKLKPLGNNKQWLIARGVFGTIALTLFFYSIKHLPVSVATTFQYLSPIFTVVFAIFILGEPMAKRQFLYFGLAFIGVYLVKDFSPEVSLLLLGAGVLSAIFSGLGYNCIRKLRATDHPLVVVFYFPLIATPIMAVLSWSNWINPSLVDWFWLLAMSICTQVGQYYMAKAYQAEKANRIAGLKYLGVILAILIDLFLLNYKLNLEALIGMAIIAFGILLNLNYTGKQNKKEAIKL
jgi:drug/metabolite transporter (DMT)-like permease